MLRLSAAAFGLAFVPSVYAGDGAALFAQNCALCHQSSGSGLPGQFPRLVGRVPIISNRPEGRTYLIDVLTYGMSGTVNVDDEDIIGLMPPFASLPNAVVADILSYVQSLGEVPRHAPAPFSEQEVAAARAKPAKSPDDVQAERQTLKQKKVIP